MFFKSRAKPADPQPPLAEPAEPAEAAFCEVLDPRFLLDDPMVRGPLERADALLGDTPSDDRPALFDQTSIEAFALLCAGEYEGLPNLRAWLPSMPPVDRQAGSVGTTGAWSLLQAAAFVRIAVAAFEATGRQVKRARVLDYGVCWARLSRLFYKYTPVERLYGVDAWPESLNLARQVGYRGSLGLVDPTPERLPFKKPFDLVFAFSIFTHLSPRSADAAARAIRSGMAADGLFVLTIRPSAFWGLLGDKGPGHRDQLAAEGFGFTPDDWAVAGGNLDYGNATISLDYIRANWSGFEVVGVELLAIDAYQVCVILRAV